MIVGDIHETFGASIHAGGPDPLRLVGVADAARHA